MSNNNLGNSIPRDGLVGEWLLDGNRNDTSGNLYNGTNTNGVYVKTTKGYQSQAWQGNGTNSYVNMGNVLDETGTTPFSLSIWIKYSADQYHMIFGKQLNTGDYTGYMLYYDNQVAYKKLTFTLVSTTTNYLEVKFPSGYTDGQWHHIVVTYDGSKTPGGIKGYVDNNLISLTTSINTLTGSISSVANLNIGSRNNGGLPFNGITQLARKYNRVLPQEEIQLLYLEGQRKLGPTNIRAYPNLLDGLVYYADFKGSAHNLVDGVNGTVNGATLTTDRFGNSNSAYNFNTANANILVNAPTGLSTSAISYSVWIKSTLNSTTENRMVQRNGNGRHFSFGNGLNGGGTAGKIEIGVVRDGIAWDGIQLTSNGSYNDGIYHHWVFTKNGANVAIYKDGVLDNSSASFDAQALDISQQFLIGPSGSTPNRIYDNFEIWNKALTADEVSSLYKLTSQDYIYPSPSYSLLNLQEGLVLDLNEQGKDLSGNGNHGTLVNAPQVVRQGKAKGLAYNNTNTYITVPLSIPNSYTISFWVKNNTLTTDAGNIIAKDDGTTRCFSYQQYSTAINFYGWNASGVIKNVNSGILTTSKWYHFALTWDSVGNFICYQDGLLSSGTNNVSTGGNARDSAKSIYIGRSEWTGNEQYFNGNIISPRIRDRVLSAKEIQQLYYSQKANFTY